MTIAAAITIAALAGSLAAIFFAVDPSMHPEMWRFYTSALFGGGAGGILSLVLGKKADSAIVQLKKQVAELQQQVARLQKNG